MYVLASLLDPDNDTKTREIWNWLEINCGLNGINMTPLPHISWLVAELFDSQKLESEVEKISKNLKPFKVKAAGLGVFSGINPILYVNVVKTWHLIKIHKNIWGKLKNISINSHQYYSPEEWVPHITLASRDVTPEKMACAIKELSFKPIQMDIVIDNLALLYVINNEVGVQNKFDLNSGI